MSLLQRVYCTQEHTRDSPHRLSYMRIEILYAYRESIAESLLYARAHKRLSTQTLLYAYRDSIRV